MLEVYSLRDDTFPLTPIEGRDCWYGFRELRGSFRSLHERSLREAPRLCVLNRGQFGAGKTHAALYFTHTAATLCEEISPDLYASTHAFHVETPKQGKGAFSQLYQALADRIQLRHLKAVLLGLIEQLGKASVEEYIYSRTGSEDLAIAVAACEDDTYQSLRTYLLGGGSSAELRKIGAARRLSSETDFANALVGLFSVLVKHAELATGKPCRIFVWVDEMEDLVYYSSKDYLPFTQSLRHFLDRMSQHLTLFLNFTFSEPEELATIEEVLGQAVMDRVNEHVLFRPPNVTEVKQYLDDLLLDNYIGGTADELRKLAPHFPFDDDAFSALSSACEHTTPRYTHKLTDRLLRVACDRDMVSADHVVGKQATDALLAESIDAISTETLD